MSASRQQIFGVFVIAVPQRDANRGRRENFLAAQLKRAPHRVLHALGDQSRVAQVGDVFQQQRELVAAKTRNRIAGPQTFQQTPRN